MKPATGIEYSSSKFACCIAVSALAAAAAIIPVNAMPSLGLQTDIVSESAGLGSFSLVRDKQAAPLFLDSADYAGVVRAASDLRADIDRVTGIKPALTTNVAPAGKFAVIVGTLGKSLAIDALVKLDMPVNMKKPSEQGISTLASRSNYRPSCLKAL